MDVQQMMPVKEEAPEDQSAGVDQQGPEQLYIKEKQQELCTSLKGEKLHLKEETDTAVSIKSEDDKENPLFSQLHQQQQMEDRDVPTSSSADQNKAETSRSPDLNPREQTCDPLETEVGGDNDVNLGSGPETGDGDSDWNESGSSETDFKIVIKSYCCSECGEQFLHKRSLLEHMAVTNHSAIGSSGYLVNKKYFRVKQHVQNEQQSFSCVYCGTNFIRKKSLNRHMRVHKHFDCDLCGQKFCWKKNLKKHMRVHTEQKSFACELCGRKFTRETTLNRHMSVHTVHELACELCGQKFSRKKSLSRHMSVHTGKKPFACELCGQRFNQKTNLNIHTRVHTGEKPFSCELCGQRFAQKGGLDIHMRIHTGEKPFACDLCGQRFIQKCNLDIHMRVHTGQKPFACGLCARGFSHWTTLSNHMSRHTGHKPFVCELCGQRFCRKSILQGHMRIHTGHKKLL